jgi:hypothetical protein
MVSEAALYNFLGRDQTTSGPARHRHAHAPTDAILGRIGRRWKED